MTQHFTISDELLSAYLDQQVTEAETSRVEKSLATDQETQQRLDDLQAVLNLLHDAPAAVAPRAFTLSEADVVAAGGRIKGAPQPSFWARWLPRMMPAATAIVAVLFFLSLMPASNSKEMLAMPQSQPAMVEAPAEARPVAKVVEVTKIVEKEVEKAAPQAKAMSASSPQAAEPRGVSRPTAAPPAAAPANSDAVATNATTDSDDCGSDEAPQAESAGDGLCLPDELSEDAFAAPAAEPAPAPRTKALNLKPWLLGGLLLILLFLTWKITLMRPRRR